VGDFTRLDVASWGAAPRAGEAPKYGNGRFFKFFLKQPCSFTSQSARGN